MTNNERILLEKLEKENIESLSKRGRGTELEKYCSWIGISKHGTAREKAIRLLNWYDSNTYKERLKKYEHLKLKINIKTGTHGKTVRGSISQYLWLKKIRPAILTKYNYKCSICGFEPEESERKQLHVHEIEEYDFDQDICELKGLELICSSCHSFYHLYRSYSVTTKAQMDELISHFTRVNEIEREEYQEYVRLLQCSWRNESIKSIDEQINKGYYDCDKIVTFKISYAIPYKEEVVKQLKKKGLYIEN
ncbi:hypothetical protein [Rummeliibacillus stabekisii]|uniref:hypothetical protein n=1 Tax=Rummeliibacillus stabekisii TaxID=241244 RepID=UPI00371F251D